MELGFSEKQTGASSKTSKGSAYTGNEKTDNKAVEEEKRIQPGADCRQEPLGGNCDGISRNDISLIWEDKRRAANCVKYLRRQGRRYAKRGSKMQARIYPMQGVDIDERPEIVELKERFGDW